MGNIGEQLGGSDHHPVYLNMVTKIAAASTIPRWNYRKAIRVEDMNITSVVKDVNTSILQASQSPFPG